MISKSILLLSFTFISTLSWAATDLRQCEMEYSNYGEDQVDQSCVEKWSQHLMRPQLKREDDAEVIASPSALFIKEGSRVSVQAGTYAQVENPVAISYSRDLKTLATLDENGDIKLYHSHIMGNIAPKKIIKNKHFYGATDLTFIPNALAVYVKNEKKVFIISLESGRTPASQQILRELQVRNSSIISITYDHKQGRLIGLSSDGQKSPL